MKQRIGLAILLILSAGAWQASQARETPGGPAIEQHEATPLERGVAAYKRGDYAVALGLFTPLAEAGDVKAQIYLSFLYGAGRGTGKDEVVAARWVGRAADQGFAMAQNSLGARYEQGLGVARDLAAAARWYRIAAEQGDAQAQSNLGRLYKSGKGVPQDDRKAATWYRKAAGQGFAPAQVILGYLYSTGRGVQRNHDKAALLYRQAAVQGDVRGQWLLGTMHQTGRGVPRDAAAAARWFEAAADQAFAEAQFSLAELYRTGEGVAPDQARAAQLFRLAAEQGHAEAQMGLATMYHQGAGVAPDMRDRLCLDDRRRRKRQYRCTRTHADGGIRAHGGANHRRAEAGAPTGPALKRGPLSWNRRRLSPAGFAGPPSPCPLPPGEGVKFLPSRQESSLPLDGGGQGGGGNHHLNTGNPRPNNRIVRRYSVSTLASTAIDWPETLRPASESRNAAIAAMSPPVTMRRIETCSRNRASISS
jgi:TPR repeat protein